MAAGSVFARFPRNFTRYIRYTTIHKMERYIKEVLGEDERQAVDYHDYLKMAEKLGYNMREPWILFPKNLEQRHEELIEESREREIKAKEDLDNKKTKVREIQKTGQLSGNGNRTICVETSETDP